MPDKEAHIPGPSEARPLIPFQEPTPQSEPNRYPPISLQNDHPLVPVSTQPVKNVLKRKFGDDDPFVDNALLPSPSSRSPMKRGRPPVLKEGPYRNSYVPAQHSVETAVWPPERNRKDSVVANKKLATPAIVTEPAAQVQQVRRRLPQNVRQHVNAVASSSKVKLPDAVVQTGDPFPKSPPSSKTVQQANKRPKSEHNPNESNYHTYRDVVTNKTLPFAGAIECKKAGDNMDTLPRIDLRESLQNRSHSRNSTSRKGSIFSSRASASASHSSFGVPHYNRRRESAVSSDSCHNRPSMTDEMKNTLISLLEQEMEKIGKEYGFSGSVALKTFLETGSFEKMRAVLTHMNKSMIAVQQGLYEAQPDLFRYRAHESDNDDSFPEGVTPARSTPGQTLKDKAKKSRGFCKDMALQQRPRGKNPRPSLNYKPPFANEQETLSDYSPPYRTRARRYSKLRKEGREEEALAVAIGDIPARPKGSRTSLHERSVGQGATEEDIGGIRERWKYLPQPTMIRRGMEPSSPAEMQASPVREDEISGSDDQDPFQDAKRRRLKGDVAHYEVADEGAESESDSDVNSDTKMEVEQDESVAQLMRMEEHKRLSSEVNMKNQDEMRAFELENDPDLLRRWTADWIRQRVTTMREVQERRQEHDRITAEKARMLRENMD